MQEKHGEALRLAAIGVVVAAIMAAVLAAMGRSGWCSCGSPIPWSFDIWSAHNSQHLLDPYSFTHFQHGLAFFALLWLPLRRWDLAWRFALALCIEAAWEILENTDQVIEHYRETTISLDYYGDSIANSISDLLACALGFLFAARTRWWLTLGLFVGIELVLVLVIRDSLLLNILMLLLPLEGIRSWQMAV